ncbi:MAG: DMT family transporter [Rhodobacteraceae bacterium]|nr:DMT family transporter [Paracoccaceae bacterium]
MSEWIIALDGTPEGRHLALGLALMSAVLHAVFGALQKGRHDPWLTRGAIDASYGLMALPVALFLVPWPSPRVWLILVVSMGIHIVYKLLQAMTYSRGAFTVVYPVVRGTGPLVTVLVAGVVFSENFAPLQWLGVVLLTAAVFALAGINVQAEALNRRRLVSALILALVTGALVAIYTIYDAYGIRASADPFTFLAWFFVMDALIFPWIALVRYKRMQNPPDLPPLLLRGVIGGVIALASFGGIILATRLDKVGEAAVLRETSTVFAALIGWLFLKEKVGLLRATFMVVIAAGAVLVEFGG